MRIDSFEAGIGFIAHVENKSQRERERVSLQEYVGIYGKDLQNVEKTIDHGATDKTIRIKYRSKFAFVVSFFFKDFFHEIKYFEIFLQVFIQF